MRERQNTTTDSSDLNNQHGFTEQTAQRLAPGLFAFERLDAFTRHARGAGAGDHLARQLPRGYAALADNCAAFALRVSRHAEASSRTGNDRLVRLPLR